MGEVLRALLDKACIDSNPAYYGGVVGTINVTNTGTRTFAEADCFIQCKADTLFLVQGFAWFGSMISGGVSAFPGGQGANGFTVFNVKTGKSYSFAGTIPKAVQNTNGNNFRSLPEYILFEAGDLIGIRQRFVVTETFTATARYYVTLAGIEYRMPGGKGYTLDAFLREKS